MAQTGAPRSGVSLDGLGWASTAPASSDGRAGRELFDVHRLVGLADLARRAGFDYVSLDESFESEPSPLERSVSPDAVLASSAIAGSVPGIGVVAGTTVTHTEPFHVAKRFATLDFVSFGRAGWKVGVSTSEQAARHFGLRDAASAEAAWSEATIMVDLISLLWDSWEDDAVIRDEATERYLDRSKVHHVDFTGPDFTVAGPLMTPRPPQGQVPVFVEVDESSRDLAARQAEVAIVSGATLEEIAAQRTLLADEVASKRTRDGELLVLAELWALTSSASDPTLARGAVVDLDPAQGLGQVEAIAADLGVDGVHLRLDSLDALGQLPPRGTRTSSARPTLRELLGLARPANRFLTADLPTA